MTVRLLHRKGETVVDYGEPRDIRHAVSAMERELVAEVRRLNDEATNLLHRNSTLLVERDHARRETTVAHVDADTYRLVLEVLVGCLDAGRPVPRAVLADAKAVLDGDDPTLRLVHGGAA